ncbi:MAG: hypothetical protein WC333_02355 [Dehalococcoidia bacterium]|jgi:hypothetical protein
MKVWIKLDKYFRGGSHTDYKHLDQSEIDTDAKQQELMENWGENTDGGYEDGYRVCLHVMDKDEHPPKEWLEKQVKRAVSNIKFIKNEKVKTKKERLQKEMDNIEFYKQIMDLP